LSRSGYGRRSLIASRQLGAPPARAARRYRAPCARRRRGVEPEQASSSEMFRSGRNCVRVHSALSDLTKRSPQLPQQGPGQLHLTEGVIHCTTIWQRDAKRGKNSLMRWSGKVNCCTCVRGRSDLLSVGALSFIECELRDEGLAMCCVPEFRSGVPENVGGRSAGHLRPMRALYLDIR
jgi:hypothetical protein